MAVLRNLWRNRLRTVLTLLGVAAGTAVLVSLLSVTASLKGQIQALLVNQRLDVAVQARGAASPARSRISRADYEALSRVPGVRETAALVVGSIQTPWNPYFVIFGVSGLDELSSQVRLVEGRMFAPGQRALMLGELAARELGYRVGNKIMLAEDEFFSVVGIYSLGVGIGDGGAILDLADARRLLQQGDYINLAFVRAAGAVDPVVDGIRRAFPHLLVTRTGELVGELRISLPLDRFRVACRPGEPPRILEIDGSAARAAEWSVYDFRPAPGFVGAAVMHGGPRPLSLVDFDFDHGQPLDGLP